MGVVEVAVVVGEGEVEVMDMLRRRVEGSELVLAEGLELKVQEQR